MRTQTTGASIGLLARTFLVLGGSAARGDEPRVKITGEWPTFSGVDGTRADPSRVPLLDDLSRARLAWVSGHEGLGQGKTSSAARGGRHCYGPLKRVEAKGFIQESVPGRRAGELDSLNDAMDFDRLGNPLSNLQANQSEPPRRVKARRI